MTDRKYTAPALEKGLDILDLMARHGQAMTMSQISATLGRSVSELFRMIHVLEFKGFIEATASGDGYQLTNRLFTLGMARAPVKTLLEAALPLMRDLAAEAEQSCHLAIVSRDEIVVVARIENPGYFGYSVRTGHRRPIVESTSGLALYAFQPSAVQDQWRDDIFRGVAQTDQERFLADAARAASQGYWRAESDLTPGVVDISAPVMVDGAAAAALTIPYMSRKGSRPVEATIEQLRATAHLISSQIHDIG